MFYEHLSGFMSIFLWCTHTLLHTHTCIHRIYRSYMLPRVDCSAKAKGRGSLLSFHHNTLETFHFPGSFICSYGGMCKPASHSEMMHATEVPPLFPSGPAYCLFCLDLPSLAARFPCSLGSTRAMVTRLPALFVSLVWIWGAFFKGIGTMEC